MNTTIISHGMILKRIREEFEIKQLEIAQLLGVSQQYISKLEKKYRIDRRILSKIAEYLEIGMDIFYQFREEKLINLVIIRHIKREEKKKKRKIGLEVSKEEMFAKEPGFSILENEYYIVYMCPKNRNKIN